VNQLRIRWVLHVLPQALLPRRTCGNYHQNRRRGADYHCCSFESRSPSNLSVSSLFRFERLYVIPFPFTSSFTTTDAILFATDHHITRHRGAYITSTQIHLRLFRLLYAITAHYRCGYGCQYERCRLQEEVSQPNTSAAMSFCSKHNTPTCFVPLS
jgi:hypothetical protein